MLPQTLAVTDDTVGVLIHALRHQTPLRRLHDSRGCRGARLLNHKERKELHQVHTTQEGLRFLTNVPAARAAFSDIFSPKNSEIVAENVRHRPLKHV